MKQNVNLHIEYILIELDKWKCFNFLSFYYKHYIQKLKWPFCWIFSIILVNANLATKWVETRLINSHKRCIEVCVRLFFVALIWYLHSRFKRVFFVPEYYSIAFNSNDILRYPWNDAKVNIYSHHCFLFYCLLFESQSSVLLPIAIHVNSNEICDLLMKSFKNFKSAKKHIDFRLMWKLTSTIQWNF